MEESSDDRISQLPDDILVDIISSLLLKETGRTSILSSRWRNLWKHTSRLNFEADSALDKIAGNNGLRGVERVNYERWVNKVLDSCKTSSALLEFSVHFGLDNSLQSVISRWLVYACARRVQRLELDLLEYGEQVGNIFTSANYVFPEELLYQAKEGSSGVRQFSYESLKVLSLKCVNVSGEALEFFLRNCPSLEQLVVWGSFKLKTLTVSGSSPRLKH